MKSKFTSWCLTLLGLLLVPAVGLANSSNANQENQDKSAKVRTVTGCLSKGESNKEYTLTTNKGATWEVKSDAVNFATHVGHEVTLTGTVDNATMHGAKEKAKEETMDNANEHGHMTVTTLKMVSESCHQ